MYVVVNIRCFPKMKINYFVTSASSFDKNNYHITHTVSRSVIIFQAEKVASQPLLVKHALYFRKCYFVSHIFVTTR